MDALLASYATDLTVMPARVSLGGDMVMNEEIALDGAEEAPMYKGAVGGGRPMMMMARGGPEMMVAMAMPAMADAPPVEEPPGGASGGGGASPTMARAKSAQNGAKSAQVGGGGGGDGAATAGVAVKVRSAFESTPLFMPRIPIDASGRTTITWRLPDNTGAYELRAYAVRAQDGALGGGSTVTQLVRKRVTLAASVPRVARVGDTFECGVTATGSPELRAGTTIVASLRLLGTARSEGRAKTEEGAAEDAAEEAVHTRTFTEDAADEAPLHLLGAHEQTFTLGPSQSVEVLFTLTAARLGKAKLVAMVREVLPPPSQQQQQQQQQQPRGEGGLAATDAIELSIPVEGVQPAVVVATSMALRATRALPTVWPEAIQLPPAIPGSATLTIGATAGRLAVVRSLAQSLIALPRWNDEPDAASVLGALAAAPMLAPYARAVSSGGQRGAVSSAKGSLHEVLQGAATAIGRATTALDSMTSIEGGLHYSARARSYASGGSVDLHLNALGLWVLRRLELAPRDHDSTAAAAMPAALRALGDRWRAALANGLATSARESIEHFGQYDDLETLAVSRLALGAAWRPGGVSAAVTRALSLEALARGVDRLSVHGKAAYALTMMLPAEQSADAAAGREGRFFACRDASANGACHDEGAVSAEGGGADRRVLAILRYLASCLRVSGRTAYVARDATTWDAAGPSGTALALSAIALARLQGGVPLSLLANVEKLANHVGAGGFGYGGGAVGLSGASLHEGFALADYDAASGSIAADIELIALLPRARRVGMGIEPGASLRAMAAPALVYDAHLRALDAAPPAVKTVAWTPLLASLPPLAPLAAAAAATDDAAAKTVVSAATPPTPLLFIASGHGEASVALALAFTPAQLAISPISRGLDVQKIIRRYDARQRCAVGPHALGSDGLSDDLPDGL